MTRDDTNNDIHLTGYLMTSLVYAVDVIGVTPDEITKVGARYWWFIGHNAQGGRAITAEYKYGIELHWLTKHQIFELMIFKEPHV